MDSLACPSVRSSWMLVRNNLTRTDLTCNREAFLKMFIIFFLQIGEKAEFLNKSAQKR